MAQRQPEVGMNTAPAQKLHPRILRSTFLECVTSFCKGGAYCLWFKDLKAQLDDPQSSTSIDLNQVPVINQFYTTTLLSEMGRRSSNPVDKVVPMPDELFNSIHPLVARSQWPHLSDEHWTLIQPVLRLASMFLQVRSCWEWYEHVATGALKRDQHGRGFINPPSIPLEKEERQHAVESILSKMVESTLFDFARTKTKGNDPDIELSGYASISRDDMYSSQKSWIVINQEKLTSLANYKASTDTRLDFLVLAFFTAKTLLHEIAHVFYNTAHRFASRTLAEPSFRRHGPLSRIREMGKSWEQVTFGYCPNIHHNIRRPGDDASALSPPTAIELPLTALSRYYPGLVDVGSTDISDLCQHFAPSTWVPKWFQRSTWDKITKDGLAFMRDEACSYAIRHKKDYPIAGWCITYTTTPRGVDVCAVAWPYAAIYTKNGTHSILFDVRRSEMEDEMGYTVKEKEFALAWEDTYGRINVKALLRDREVCIKHGKRKWVGGNDIFDGTKRKRHKPDDDELLFLSNWLEHLAVLDVDAFLE